MSISTICASLSSKMNTHSNCFGISGLILTASVCLEGRVFLNLFSLCNGQCAYTDAMLRIENGFLSDVNSFRVVSTNFATGSLGYTCNTGFTFNPTIGNRLTCLSTGAWSPLPVCQSTGRCPMSTLTAFLQSTSTMTSMTSGGSFSLPTDGVNTTNVLSGAFVPMACNAGLINVGGPLNITCINGAWTQFPNCVSSGGGGGGSVVTTAQPGGSGGRCPVTSTTFTIANGFISSATNMLIFPDTSTASGWLLFSCSPGFALDPAVGGNFSCNNGVWSTQPRCINTGRCPMASLTQLMSTGTLLPTGSSQLLQTQDNTTHVLGGSFMVFTCATGLTNMGGSLNVTCLATNAWSTAPNCVTSGGGGGGSVVTTTQAAISGARCPVTSTSFTIANGFISSATNMLIFPDTSTASGWLLFSCATGFALDPAIGGNFSCNNGVWSSQPRCISTGRCPIATVTQLTSTGSIIPTGSMQLQQTQDNATHVLGGSFIVFACAAGLTNIGGSLNMTCLATNSWSTPPNCVSSGSGGGSMTTTTTVATGGSTSGRCPLITNTLTIANGFISNANSLLIFSDTSSATGWVGFSCNNGFTLDPTVGGNFSCNNGVWSTQPRCISTGRCLLSSLTQLISTGTILPTSSSQLIQAQENSSLVTGGSFMVVTCATGLTNVGGSLNVTCLSTNTWSSPPNCVASGGGVQTTTVSNNGAFCPYAQSMLIIPNGMASNWNGLILATANQAMAGSFIDYMCNVPFVMSGSSRITCTNGAWTAQPTCNLPGAVTTTIPTSTLTCAGIPSIANGYISNGSLIHFGNNNYQGQVQLTCNAGYSFANNVANRWISCVNGQWEALPVCGASALCPLSQLQNSISTLMISSHSLNIFNGNIIPGGWVLFRCRPGLNLNAFSGSLNVTCQTSGQWTTFPVCA